MDYITNDEVVAEGRWQTQEPKTLVNGIPLGPNAIKVFVDIVVNPNAFLWRPTIEIGTMEHALQKFVSWPANRVSIEETTSKSDDIQPKTTKAATPTSQNEKSPVTPNAPLKKLAVAMNASTNKPQAASPRRRSQRLAFTVNQKCKLMDIFGKNRVVAEGRWSSNDPNQLVHFVPLGPNACRILVDVVKVKDAAI